MATIKKFKAGDVEGIVKPVVEGAPTAASFIR